MLKTEKGAGTFSRVACLFLFQKWKLVIDEEMDRLYH